MFKSLEQTFNVEEAQYEIIESKPISNDIVPVQESNDLDENEKYIELELKNAINTTNDASIKILELAEISESPRAYEVAATMIKTKLDALKELKDLRRKKPEQSTGNTVVNNTQINGVFPTNINEVLKKLSAQQN
jgi:hypothetical protein